MPGKGTLKILVVSVLLAIAAFGFRSWLESHDDHLQLVATLDAQKQLISAAGAREQNRAAELKDTLAQIAALKRAVQTPQQIAAALQQFIPLPKPIGFTTTTPNAPDQRGTSNPDTEKGTHPSEKGSSSETVRSPSGQNPQQADSSQSPSQVVNEALVAQLPSADLKPLYDFVQDCRACQAQLTSVRADLADEQIKSAALFKERNAALTAAKGGSFWTRLKRNARWFALGAGFGAAATLASSRR
jgi:hypothetical protein